MNTWPISRAICLGLALAGPVAAQDDDGITAALQVCATPGLTVSDLTAGLTDAGWMQATANLASHERYALSAAADSLIVTGSLMENAGQAFTSRMTERQPVMPDPGAPMDAQAILAALGGGATVWAMELGRDGADATLVVLIAPERKNTSAVRVDCRVLSGTPLPADFVDRLLPEGAVPDLDRQSGGAPQATLRSVTLTLGGGAFMTVRHTDLTTAPAFATLTAEVGATARLTAILSVEMSNVPLR